MLRQLTYLFIITTIFSCSVKKPYYNKKSANWEQNKPDPNSKPEQSVFLIGDAGKPSLDKQEPTLKLLQSELEKTGESGSVFYLGDNLYPTGLPDSLAKDRKQQEKYLIEQLKILNNHKGKAVMIPGNHDWAKGKSHGWKNVQNQEEFVEAFLNKGNVFLPDDGCPGPEVVSLGEDLVAIVIDLQWWLHEYDKPGTKENSGCNIHGDGEFLIRINDAIRRNKDKKIIIATHHPLYSNGLHGGHTPLKNHIFPLTEKNKNLFLPLPVLGSIYVFYRTVLGNVQDIPHPRYKQIRKALTTMFQQHPNIIYVAGHDHSLQFLQKDNTHYIISGSGSKETHIARRSKANFAYSKKGFSRLDFYDNGDVWVTFLVPEGDGSTGKVVYRQKLMNQPKIKKDTKDNTVAIDYSNQTKDAMGVKEGAFKAGSFKKAFFGKNYRKEWKETIKNVRVFDIGKERGGLKIVQRGGGMQTKSLRLEDKNGKQYVLRSIEKFPEKAIPVALRGTVAADIVFDQLSASHPYGAFVVPFLAEAAGVYHTNPELVYLPDDPRLGKYQSDFANGLYLYEERPAKDRSDVASFGNSKKIDNTLKVLKKTQKNHKYYVDQEHVLRSRLFDVWIGDWDRHDDQWRWASFKGKKNTTYYRPIPRDRDQAFFFSDGFFLGISTRKWGMRKMQGFHRKLRDPEGLAFNARYFDRSFLTEMELEDWTKMAQTLQKALTDDVIENAIKKFPPEIYQYHGDDIIAKLKTRRNDLESYAKDIYSFLAKNVNVMGSNKRELFKIKRKNDQETEVKVFKLSKKGEKKRKLYDRTFKNNETQEVRLYGLGGDDQFVVKGKTHKSTLIRIIGGTGEDIVTDSSEVTGASKKTVYYDNLNGNKLEGGSEIKDKRSDDPNVNNYNRKEFKYDVVAPALFFSFNPDDGGFLGGGVSIKKHGFRKDPFKSKHLIRGNYALNTGAFNLNYKGVFTSVLGNWDLVLNADIRQPSFVDFFYGLGNESKREKDEDLGFYRVRHEQLLLNPQLRWKSKNQKQTFAIGAYFQSYSIEREDVGDDRFISTYLANNKDSVLIDEGSKYGGITLDYIIDGRDNKNNPTTGIYFDLAANYISGSDQDEAEEINFLQLKSNLAFYLSTGGRFNTVLAARVGGAANFGKYRFFQANTLGGLKNLRGFRRMRFAGDNSFYSNTELRIKLFNVRTYLFPAQFGIMAINDFGRVWYDDEIGPGGLKIDSNKWHHGYGGGVWFTPFQAATIAADYTRSDDGKAIFIRLGFFF